MPVTEIASDTYRISTYIPEIDLQFNQFLVTDEQPLLFHTGMKALFPLVWDEVASIIDPSTICWISFSHFEADECGSLNEWLQAAPNAQAVCSEIGAMVSVNDFAIRPALGMNNCDVLNTGKYRFRFLQTPYLPHGWDAGLLFEEVEGTLFSSDLFHQGGDLEPLTESDVIERSRKTLMAYQASPLANYMPYTHLAKIYYPRISRRTGKKTAKVFWNEAYSIDSVGVTKLDILIRYVKSQPKELLDKLTRGESLESD